MAADLKYNARAAIAAGAKVHTTSVCIGVDYDGNEVWKDQYHQVIGGWWGWVGLPNPTHGLVRDKDEVREWLESHNVPYETGH